MTDEIKRLLDAGPPIQPVLPERPGTMARFLRDMVDTMRESGEGCTVEQIPFLLAHLLDLREWKTELAAYKKLKESEDKK